jgi:hypothetical protein
MAMRGVIERPSGLSYGDDLITLAEEAALLARFAQLEVTPLVMHGVPSRRLTRQFGIGYDFDRRGTVEVEPLPDYLLGLRAGAAETATDPESAIESQRHRALRSRSTPRNYGGPVKRIWPFLVPGVLLSGVGLVWTLQGLDVLRGSAMSGSALWATIGPIVLVMGLVFIGIAIAIAWRRGRAQ